jgi:hypothetical protein
MLCAPHYTLKSSCDWIQLFSSHLFHILCNSTLSQRSQLPAVAYVFKSSTEPTRFLDHSARTCSWMHSPITNLLLIHLPGKNSLYNFQVLDSCMQFCEAGILQIYFK